MGLCVAGEGLERGPGGVGVAGLILDFAEGETSFKFGLDQAGGASFGLDCGERVESGVELAGASVHFCGDDCGG